MRSLHLIRFGLVVQLMILGGVFASPTAEAASMPTCTGYSGIGGGGGTYELSQPSYSPAIPSAYGCLLGRGDANAAVAALQAALRYCYVKAIVIDGIFGTATYNALYAVQGSIGVTKDGVYGSVTKAHMRFAKMAVAGGNSYGGNPYGVFSGTCVAGL